MPIPTVHRRWLLAGLLALAACGQTPQTGSTPTAPTAAAPTRPALTSLGTYELSITGATTANPTASIRPAGGLTGQAQEVGGLTFDPLSFGTFTDEQNKVRYLRATFRVTNGSGVNLTAPAYIPIDTEGTGATVGTTPFREVRYFDGSDASARALDLRVDTPRRLNAATGMIEADPDATPLAQNLNTGDLQVSLADGQQLAGVAHQGWQAGAVAAGGTQVVTFATQIPMASSPAQDPFAFHLVFSVADNPGTLSLTNIGAVQGSTPSGDAPVALTTSQTVEGVVTSVHTANVTGSLKGFFLQEEGIDADRDPTTSDGIFVYCNADCPAVAAGDRVRVVGTPAEFNTASQLVTSSASVTRLSTGQALPPALAVTLPLPVSERERYEGMRLTLSGVVTNNFPLGRGASFDIADDRIPTYTQVNRPSVSGLAAYTAQVANRTFRIDDGSRAQNPDPVIFARDRQPLSASNTLRGGDRVQVTGVVGYGNDGWTGSGSVDTYRLQASSATITGDPRPASPDVGGTLRLGSMNVLNFFTTINGSSNTCTAGGTGAAGTTTGLDPRGANTCDEFLRQRTKTVQAIRGLNPDVLGILEMENDFVRGAGSSIANLVNALNDPATGGTPGRFAYVDPGANVGSDAISVAMIYQPGRVTPVGNLAILDKTFDASYLECNRPTLARTFQSNANGGRVTVFMAHLKSKGSACNGDADQGDGQGASNATRLAAAKVLTRWMATNPTGVAEDDRVLFGDLNAYRMEDPILALLRGADDAAGTADDLVSEFGPESYSYQFDGQWGSLDHAIASASLHAQVTGAAKWHINADEPTVLDYNTEFKSAAQQSSFYAPDPFRSSDHDPVLIGVNLTAQAPIQPPAPTPTVALTPETASVTATADGSSKTQSFIATGTNITGDLTVTVTPQNGAPNIASAPATVSSGAAFNVTVTAPTGTAPGTYTYEVKAANGSVSDTSTLTVTVQAPASGPAFGNLVISQVYGGGGNNGAPYRSDFVELFNRGTQPVSTAGLSLQYTSASGTFSAAPFALPTAMLQPGQYYLVKMADGANTAAPVLPTPDAAGTFAMSGTAGKIALVNNADVITSAADADVIDFVGFGGANEREGTATAPAPSNTTSDLRKLNGCQDTNQNGDDFTTGAPAPRNSASPLNVCNVP
ncbi:ExeM/NucH family extracellular endonuclease [Deinococcus aluminii]|uniref:LTD domain-containing protein n=1 Tax=Deinococcus aluminii TaxID=1656885 RepID=A0ABP9XCT9_9DEIO